MRRPRISGTLALLAAALGFGACARGEGPPTPSATPSPSPRAIGWERAYRYRGPWVGGSRLALAGAPSVQAHLGLDEDQRARLVGPEVRQVEAERTRLVANRAWQRAEGEEREAILARVESLARRLDDAPARILTRAQLRRLDEIALQQAGPLVVRDPRLARRLNLGPDQVEALAEVRDAFAREVEEAVRRRFGTPPTPPGLGGPETQRPEYRENYTRRANEVVRLRREFEAREVKAIGRILTDGQRRAYRAMLGEPFDLETLTTSYFFRVEAKAARPETNPTPAPSPTSTPRR